MQDLRVWLRVGDQGEYESFDSVDGAACGLHDELGMTISDEMPLTRYVGKMLVGVEIGEYREENAISLYWGDDAAQIECPLSDCELEMFRSTLHAG